MLNGSLQLFIVEAVENFDFAAGFVDFADPVVLALVLILFVMGWMRSGILTRRSLMKIAEFVCEIAVVLLAFLPWRAFVLNGLVFALCSSIRTFRKF